MWRPDLDHWRCWWARKGLNQWWSAFWIGVFCGWLMGCASPTEPIQTTIWGDDGCSSSPDLGDGAACCVVHDADYSLPGDATDRLIADLDLMHCLLTWNVPAKLAWAYYSAVRRFGKPFWTDGPPRRIGYHRGSWSPLERAGQHDG